jgi:aryl-alcohol dehydrogenase-like predicted oxidoreductase
MLRQLGRTGLRVSSIGLGLAALGRPGYITIGHRADLAGTGVDHLRHATFDVLDAALASGVRYIDAARSYGRAEEFLGGWLEKRAVAPGAVTIGTKWGYTYTANWSADAKVNEVKEHSLRMLRRQVGESKALLGSNLDLLQAHSVTLDSRILRSPELLDELIRLRSEGIVRAIGLTLTGPKQGETLRAAMRLEHGGVRIFDAVQATFNVLETSCADALAEAHAAGFGVLVKETLANGRLVRDKVADVVRANAAVLGATADALAIAFVLEQPWADVVLIGPATVSQLRSNLRALDLQLDPPSRTALEALREGPEDYWHRRAALPWQ